MTWIAVDIDDTLYSFNNLAREVFVDVALETGNKRLQRGAYCAWTEWRSPADVTEADVWLQVIDRCHSEENILRQTPFAGAASVLSELYEQGEKLHYISTRREESTEATTQWLRQSGFPVSGHRTKLTCNRENKIPQLRECQYVIDDRPQTLVQFVYDFHWLHRHGSENETLRRQGFGLHTPYNAALTDVPGVKLAPNWKLLRQYMLEQKVLRGARVALVH